MTQREALVLAQDTIRIALKTAGYENVDAMSQFERASAMIDMAQEYRSGSTWERLSIKSWEYTLRGKTV